MSQLFVSIIKEKKSFLNCTSAEQALFWHFPPSLYSYFPSFLSSFLPSALIEYPLDIYHCDRRRRNKQWGAETDTVSYVADHLVKRNDMNKIITPINIKLEL